MRYFMQFDREDGGSYSRNEMAQPVSIQISSEEVLGKFRSENRGVRMEVTEGSKQTP